MFYLINKTSGISSFQAISNFARANKIEKIGHSGTLDPLASGALLVATNNDTKLLSYITNTTKTYIVTLQLGYTSDTFDSTSKMTRTSNKIISLASFKKALKGFVGKQMQIPPQYSAKKVNGQRSYQLARKGIATKLQPVAIEVFKISNVRQLTTNVFTFTVLVSAGTYIRSLVSDLGAKLEVGAIMTKLKRTHVGNQKLDGDVKKINPFEIINLPSLEIDNLKDLQAGKPIASSKSNGLHILLFSGHIIGIGVVKNSLLRVKKLFGKRISELQL